MTNEDMKNGILARLAEVSPNMPLYDEQIKQGFREPAFFVHLVSSSQTRGIDRRYLRSMLFTIRFFPDPDGRTQKGDCHAMADRLYEALEYVDWAGTTYRGHDLRHEVIEGSGPVLHFFVSFDVFLLKAKESVPKMQQLEQEGKLK